MYFFNSYTPAMKLSELFDLKKSIINIDCDVEITGASLNSKDIKSGDVFVAIYGAEIDGLSFAIDAVNNGAVAVVCDKKSNLTPDLIDFFNSKKVFVFQVEDSEQYAGKIAKILYPNQPEFVFAITGTNGKTATVDLTEQLLNIIGIKSVVCLGTMGLTTRNLDLANFADKVNKLIGVNPNTTQDVIRLHKILNLAYEYGITHFVMEASSDGIMRNRIYGVEFQACAVSNITEDHLNTHKTLENYANTKIKLYSYLKQNGFAIVNSDIPYYQKICDFISGLSDKDLNVISYGKNADENNVKILSSDINDDKSGYNLSLSVFGKKYDVSINMFGSFQIYNCLNALCFVLSCIGKDKYDDAILGLNSLVGTVGRMEYVAATRTGAKVFVDYAHNEDALKTSLQDLRTITSGRIINVNGISSGKAEVRTKGTAETAGKYADVVIFTYISPRFEPTDVMVAAQQKYLPSGLHGGPTRYDAIKMAIDMAENGDSIFINGQGHEKFIVEYGIPVPFYDVDVVKEIISKQS